VKLSLSAPSICWKTPRRVGTTRVRECPPPLFSWAQLSGQLYLRQESDQRAGLSFSDDEASIPQNNRDLNAGKRPGLRRPPPFRPEQCLRYSRFPRQEWLRLVTPRLALSTIYQVQSGMPLTISVFGDTANSGTVLGENPIRANVTGQPVFGPGTHTAPEWFNPAAFRCAPRRLRTSNAGRNSVYGPLNANPGLRSGA